MTSVGPAARLMDLFLSFFLFRLPVPWCSRVSTGYPFTPSGSVAHIIYIPAERRQNGTKPREEEEEEEEGKKKKKVARGRGFLGGKRAYCVILATVAARVIIISKEGQNTRTRIARR